MDFNFIIDKNYLLLKMISNRNNSEELEQWKSSIVINILDMKIVKEIEKRKETIEEFFISNEFQQFMANNNLDSKINRIIENEFFNKYYLKKFDYYIESLY